MKNIWYDAYFLKQCLHTVGLIYHSKWKMLIKKERPARTYMNATAKRIDHLFKKSGIVFWHFSVITSQAPRGCQRKCTEAVLLLLIKAVNQGSQYFFFFFCLFFSLWMCLCHSDQSRDEKRSPFLQVNKRIFHVYLMQHSLKQTFGVYKVFFFFPLQYYFFIFYSSLFSQ